MTKIKVKDNLDKLLVMMFLKSGEKESNLEKAEIMKIEEEIEKGEFRWDVVEKTFQKYKIEQEQDNVNETHYTGGYRESRRDYMNTRNKRYYKSPGRRFHRSNSRESRSSSRHRSSTPNNLKSPNRFNKTRDVKSTVNEKVYFGGDPVNRFYD